MDCIKLYLKLKQNERTEIVLDQSEAVAITLQVQNFTNLTGGETLNYFSYLINIPWEENKFALNFILDKNVKGNDILKCGRISARIECGCLAFEGNISFRSWNKKCKLKTIQAQYVGGIDNWTNCIDGDLCDLDLGLFDPDQNAIIDNLTTLTGAYNGSVNYWISLKYFGGLGGEFGIPIQYHRPDIYDAAIIDAINKKDCPNLCGDIFETEYFRRFLFSNPVQGFNYTAITFESESVQSVGSPAVSFIDFVNNWSSPGIIGGINSVVIFDPITPTFQASALTFDNINRDKKVKVKFEGILNVTNPGTTFNVTFLTGVSTFSTPSIVSIYTGPIVVNGFNQFEFEFDAIDFDPSAQIGYGFGFSNTVGIPVSPKISICFTNADLTYNVEPFELNQFLPCIPIVDYIKDLAVWINAVPFYDQNKNCVTIRPMWDTTLSPTGEKVDGFYRPTEKAIDITDEVINSASTGQLKYRETNCLKFLFCQDGSDKYANKAYERSEETFLGAIYCNPISGRQNEEQEITNSVTSATQNGDLPLNVLGSDLSIIPNVPYILDAEITDIPNGANLTYGMKPRRFYKVGLVPGEWTATLFNPDLGTPSQAVFNQYNYATQVDTALGINLGWPDQDGVPGLATTFYANTIKMNNSSGTKKVRWIPNKLRLVNQEDFFRTPVKIKDKDTGDCIFIVSQLARWLFCTNLPGEGFFIEYPE